MIFFFFFFKQKTAYEMRISDWSSDVCSSDLRDTEENMNIAECFGDNQNCSLLPSCALKSAFAEARRSFLATLETYRLSDMLRGKVPAANVAVARLPEKMSAKLNSLAKSAR